MYWLPRPNSRHADYVLLTTACELGVINGLTNCAMFGDIPPNSICVVGVGFGLARK